MPPLNTSLPPCAHFFVDPNHIIQIEVKNFSVEHPWPLEMTWNELKKDKDHRARCQEAEQRVLGIVSDNMRQSNQTVPEWLDREIVSWRFNYTHRTKSNNHRTKIKKQQKEAESAAPAPKRQLDITATSSLTVSTPSRPHLPHDDGMQTDSASAQVEPVPSANGRSLAIFLCVLHPDMAQTPITKCPNVRIEADPADKRRSDEGSFDMFSDGPMKEMVETYGENFANYGGPGDPALHQYIVTCQLLRNFERSMIFKSWSWLQEQMEIISQEPSPTMKKRSARKPSASPEVAEVFRDETHRCVILLRPASRDTNLLADIYSPLEVQKAFRPTGSMKIFPSQSEFLYCSGKLGDMEALDDVANGDASYRPPTCRMSAGGSYHLKHDSCPFNESEDYVSKRSNSYGCQHVEFRTSSIETVVHRHVGPERWFYQECIPSFQDPGEFRIFIVTTNDSSALRRRRGHIIHSILTHFADNGDIVPVALAGQHWVKIQQKYPTLTPAALEQFALHIFDALRNREDATAKFESLDVGVRLDIAISPLGTLFVNEITRIWDADFFSERTLGCPCLEIAFSVAQAVHEVFS